MFVVYFNVTLSKILYINMFNDCNLTLFHFADQKMRESMATFEEGGFPGVVGLIDGTHVRIRAPMEEPDAYINRKKFHSINVQVICDENMVFTDILAGWPGSVHDSRVLRNSNVYNMAANKFPGNAHLLGDGGYPLQTWLMTPYRDNGHLTPEQTFFNSVLSSNRQTVERSIRLLKGRWRKLQYLDHLDQKLIVLIIISGCVLHNVCLLHDDFEEGYMLDNEDDDDDSSSNNHDGAGRNDRLAQQKRNRMKAIVYANRI